MARHGRSGLALILGLWLVLGSAGCGSEPSPDQRLTVSKTAAAERAERRLFDGAPPVIPHERQGASCISCHNERGMAVEGLGFSPPSPHQLTAGMSSTSRCEQCHVFQHTEEPWKGNTFVGLPQDLRSGERLFQGAPPVMPHPRLMRENCLACHSGAAAREEIRTDHPERARCNQCHLEPATHDLAAFPI